MESNTLQGSVATNAGNGGILNDHFNAHLLQNLVVKGMSESVKI